MRYSFNDRGLAEIYTTGKAKALPPAVVKAFIKTVRVIGLAKDMRDLRAIKSRHLEKLNGDREGQYSVRLNDQYRLIFTIKHDHLGNLLVLLEIIDYH